MQLGNSKFSENENVFPDFNIEMTFSVLPSFRKDLISQKALLGPNVEVDIGTEDVSVRIDLAKETFAGTSAIIASIKPLWSLVPIDMVKCAGFLFYEEMDFSCETLGSLMILPELPLVNADGLSEETDLDIDLNANGEPVRMLTKMHPDQSLSTLRIERNENLQPPRYDVIGEVQLWEDLGRKGKPVPCVTPRRLAGMAESIISLRDQTIRWLRKGV